MASSEEVVESSEEVTSSEEVVDSSEDEVSSEEVVDSSEDEVSSEEIVESSEEVASSEEVESSEEIESSEEDESSEDPAIDNWGLALDLYNFAYDVGDPLSFVTKEAYNDISEISFDVKTGATVSWWGIALTEDPNGYAPNGTDALIYDTRLAFNDQTTTNGNWMKVKATFADNKCIIKLNGTVKVNVTLSEVGLDMSKGYYVYFIGEAHGPKFENNPIYIDNFTLVDGYGYDERIIDNFETELGAGQFTVNGAVKKAEGTEPVADIVIPDGGEDPDTPDVPEIEEGEYAAKIIVDKLDSAYNTRASFITKTWYAKGSEVSFKYYIVGETTSWFNVYHAIDPNDTCVYEEHGTSTIIAPFNIIKGAWQTMTFTMPENGYIHFGGAVGEWGDGTGYVLIDNFTVDGETDDFNKGPAAGLFNVNTPDAIEYTDGYVEVTVEEGEYSMQYTCNVGGEAVALVTKEAYASGSTVSFMYYIPEGTVTSWWGIGWTTKSSDFTPDDYYAAASASTGYQPSQVTGVWTKVEFTLPVDGPYYLYITTEVGGGAGRWMCNGENAVIYIDNFTIDGEVETFNKGVAKSIFKVLVDSVITEGEGYEEAAIPDEPTEGELAMKYIFNIGMDETPSQITKEAYASGSTISFKYYIPADTVTSWWWLGYAPTNTPKYYADGEGEGHFDLPKTTGEWVEVEYMLPAGGPYYLYFVSEVGAGAGRWMLNGENSYVLIDDFSIDGDVETFNNGIKNSIFDILNVNAVKTGEGWEPLNGEFGAKLQMDMISSTKTTPSFITSETYVSDGTLTITFDYYMSGNTNSKWWTLGWTTSNTNADIYAGMVESHTTAENSAYALPTNVQDAWNTVTVTIPAGEWYFYFAGAIGEWSGGYVIIDNFAIGNIVTETFNNGEYGIFLDNRDSKPDAITIAGGKTGFVPGEYAAKLDFTNSFENNASTFITKEAYAGGSKITFKYYIPEETTIGDWWSICWDTNGSSPNFWAVGNGPVAPSGGANPNPDKLKTGKWVEYSITLPEGGPYYVYFCGYQNWNGCVYIDDFTVGSVTETFNNGLEESIFKANLAYVGLGEGTVSLSGNTMLTFEAAAIGGNERIAMITDKTYANVTEISFTAQWTGNATAARWGLSYTTDPTNFSYDDNLDAVNCYSPKLGMLKQDTGVYTYRITFTDTTFTVYANGEQLFGGDYTQGTYYFYFVICPAVGGTGSVVNIDNFSITYASGTDTDTFDNEKSTIFVDSAQKVGRDNYWSYGMGFAASTLVVAKSAPVYNETQGIDITAYAPVTVENWAGNTGNPTL